MQNLPKTTLTGENNSIQQLIRKICIAYDGYDHADDIIIRLKCSHKISAIHV